MFAERLQVNSCVMLRTYSLTHSLTTQPTPCLSISIHCPPPLSPPHTHSQNGAGGENNGANIVNANPSEIASRMSCYLENNLPIGACWALPHWYYLWTYANATVYAPY